MSNLSVEEPEAGESAWVAEGRSGVAGRDVREEVKRQLKLAAPLVVINLLQYSLPTISLIFVGHIGGLALSGAAIGGSFASVTGFSLMLGMAGGLDTLCGQAFGARQYHMLGVHLQKAMLVLALVSIPLSIIWAYTGKILVTARQDPEVAAAAGEYARWMIPAIFAFGPLQCLLRFLQMQKIVVPMMVSSGVTALVHTGICWLLVFKTELGMKGAAMATGISNWLHLVILAIYVMLSPACKTTWNGFSKEAFHDIPLFLKLSVPSGLMLCLEFWSFQLTVLLSGLLPNPKVEASVLSIVLTTIGTAFMIPSGLAGSVSTRVSNELGAGRPKAARLAVLVVVCLALTAGLTLGLLMIFVRNVWGYVFSNDKEIVKKITTMTPLIAVSIVLDASQCVLSGAARGCGWQKIGAFINLGSYYIVGVPSAVLMAFVLHLGAKGLWLGIICGLVVQFSLLSVATLCTDWNKEAKKAGERAGGGS